MERENDKSIANVTARQDAEREKQKKLQKRYEDFLKLINFVKYIENDSFWRAEVVQIITSTMSSGDLRVDFIPRSGRHLVRLGTLDNVEQKLSNEKFVSKAPEAVVNVEKEKAAKYTELIAKLEESAKAMQA